MYAKLVTGSSTVPAIGAIRDICKLLTSPAPSIADIAYFDPTVSIVIDSNPAGWSFAGSTHEVGGISTSASITDITYVANTDYIIGLSAPCRDDASLVKYVGFGISWLGADQSTNYSFGMFGAEYIDTDATLTNPGTFVTWDSAQGLGEPGILAFRALAANTYHVIANERGITIIQEGRGIGAVWETTQTTAHSFFNQVPFIQYNHYDSSNYTRSTALTKTTSTAQAAATMQPLVFNVRNVNTGVAYGTYDFTSNLTKNLGHGVQVAVDYRANTISASGLPQYQVSPIYIQVGELGYPVQYITGIVPAYWTAPNIGSTGDTVIIGGEDYSWFNCGDGFGLAMKTN